MDTHLFKNAFKYITKNKRKIRIIGLNIFNEIDIYMLYLCTDPPNYEFWSCSWVGDNPDKTGSFPCLCKMWNSSQASGFW